MSWQFVFNSLASLQVFNGRATWKQLAQNWSVSYVGNMLGTFLIVTLMTQGAVFPQMASGPINTAMPKVGLTFSQVSPSQLACLFKCRYPVCVLCMCMSVRHDHFDVRLTWSASANPLSKHVLQGRHKVELVHDAFALNHVFMLRILDVVRHKRVQVRWLPCRLSCGRAWLTGLCAWPHGWLLGQTA